MRPGFVQLLILCEMTVKSQPLFALAVSTTEVSFLTGKPPSLQVVATPDYPVAAGQTVTLHCISTIPGSVTWSWQRWQNETWKDEGTNKTLTLTKPEQSGEYRCRAQKIISSSHKVYIMSVQATVGDKLGIAALFFSLLALILILGVVLWLGSQRLSETLTISSTAVKGFPGPEMTPKGSFPQTDGDGGVYMNYTSTNQAYTNLDPANMTQDSVYSSLP